MVCIHDKLHIYARKNYCQIGTLIIRFSGSSTQFLLTFKPISFCVTLLFICLALTFDSTDRYTGPILDQAEPSGILLNRSDSPACVVSESDSPTSSRSAEGLAEKENKQYGNKPQEEQRAQVMRMVHV